MVYKLKTGQFAENPCLTTRPQIKAPTLHHWKTCPVPQLDRVPLGQMHGQPQRTYLRPERPSPPAPVPTLAPTIKTEEPPQVAAILHAMVMPKQATEKCSWNHIAPFARMRKNTKRTGMAICRTNLECTSKIFSASSHRTLGTPSHRIASSHFMSPIGMQNRFI